MKTLESRRFSGPAGAVLWLQLVQEDGRLPYRVRMKQGGRTGVLAAAATEEDGLAALDLQSDQAKERGWAEAPRRLRLALEIPKPCPTNHAPLKGKAAAPGHTLVCPDCAQEIRR